VAVIGGGIGGLSLALQLERAGIDCAHAELNATLGTPA
jgi:2-polyprenyl-6-methoxyphenol hydroxylase-like FAD-dependent oxidoreductase